MSSRLDTFDPNSKRPPTIEWATFVPRRGPEFKVHKRKADALNAVRYHSESALYRFDTAEDKWVEVARRERIRVGDDTPCVACGGTLMQFGHGIPYRAQYGGWRRTYSSGPIAEPLEYLYPVCASCAKSGVI